MSTLAIASDPLRRRAFRLLVASEVKIAQRRPIVAVVALGVPILLLVIFGSIPATTRPAAALGGISFVTLYVPTLMVFVLIAVGGSARLNTSAPATTRIAIAMIARARLIVSWAASNHDGGTGVVFIRRSTPCSR